MDPEISAGGCVVYRRNQKDQLRFLVVHRPQYGDWSLAKGKPERGETLAEAAVREVEEETGFTGKIVRELGAIRYRTAADRNKLVHYWLMKAGKGTFRPNSEVDAAEWLSYRRAAARLTYSRDGAVLEWARRVRMDPKRGRIYLVRHGSAGDRRAWRGPDEHRPMSNKGHKQAAALVELLTRVPVARILSSPYMRCVQTVEPLATAIDQKVEVDARLAEASPVASTLQLLGELAGSSAVLCTHGDIIGDLIGHAVTSGADVTGEVLLAKGSVWILDTRKSAIEHATYVPPMTERFD